MLTCTSQMELGLTATPALSLKLPSTRPISPDGTTGKGATLILLIHCNGVLNEEMILKLKLISRLTVLVRLNHNITCYTIKRFFFFWKTSVYRTRFDNELCTSLYSGICSL